MAAVCSRRPRNGIEPPLPRVLCNLLTSDFHSGYLGRHLGGAWMFQVRNGVLFGLESVSLHKSLSKSDHVSFQRSHKENIRTVHEACSSGEVTFACVPVLHMCSSITHVIHTRVLQYYTCAPVLHVLYTRVCFSITHFIHTCVFH